MKVTFRVHWVELCKWRAETLVRGLLAKQDFLAGEGPVTGTCGVLRDPFERISRSYDPQTDEDIFEVEARSFQPMWYPKGV